MRTPYAPLVALLAALPFAACGGKDPEPASKASPGGPSVATRAPAEDAATDPATPSGNRSSNSDAESAPAGSTADQEGPHVTLAGSGGRAHWVGTPPAPKTLDIDPQKSEGCDEHTSVDTTDRGVLVGASGGLANVVLEVVVQDAEATAPEETYAMDQRGCRFEPHVLVVPAGATVEFRNSDSVGHNVHTYARRNDAMNRTVAAEGSATQVYARRDQIEVKCDIHPWMNAWVVVSDAAATAISDADGSFTLAALPPGEHKVSCWHEQLGGASGTLVVGADGTIAELDLVLRKKR